MLSASTAHIVFDDLSARSPVPILSIVETCAADAQRHGLKRVALPGTRFTMEATFYREVCARHGVEVVIPTADERAWVHQRYVGELLNGDFREDTRQAFMSLVDGLRRDERIEGAILGGTELPLLLRDASIAGVPVLDTTRLHVAAIVERLRSAPAG